MQPKKSQLRRREFLQRSALAAGGVAAGLYGCASRSEKRSVIASGGQRIFLKTFANDAVVQSAPVRWALSELTNALAAHQISLVPLEASNGPGKHPLLLVGSPAASETQALLSSAKVQLPQTPEAVALVPVQWQGNPALLAAGSDARGLTYAVMELAERATHADYPFAILNIKLPIVEQPANVIRAINRAFVSDVEDKAWYHDRAFWKEYLAMLARQRFNRFALTFGIGYDFTTNIRDCYFHFAYPFLLNVPGHNVRAAGLPDAERDANLEQLRFISDTATSLGLHFQLGIWTHAYKWTNSPQANYIIEGLTPETHAPYCQEALKQVLQACPGIQGVTIRIHGESGVAEGSYAFWQTVFAGAAECGRKVEIDMHAKGMDQKMIDIALATGLPVNVSPKYWAEHMGLPYHQAAIRNLEMPPRQAQDKGFFSMSSGSRRFLRYGYGDLLAENRRHGVLHRIWPGTQRLFIWGDPVMAAGYGRASSFCGSAGVEICEPLFFKGRKGSGLPSGRDAYAEPGLKPTADWIKYRYTYLLWGRLLYNPNTHQETWRRWLRKNVGPAEAVEHDLGHASRILPLITTAHDPSAANNNYWPEMYYNMSIIDPGKRHPYGDSPSPKRFGTVSPLDPELFSTIEQYADELVANAPSGKYSPAEVARQLDFLAERAVYFQSRALLEITQANRPEFQRFSYDTEFQSFIGRFFADKLRAGVFYALYDRLGDPSLLADALKAYRAARAVWLNLSELSGRIYFSDITFGPDYYQRGNWADRLPAIDEDIAEMAAMLEHSSLVAPTTPVPAATLARVRQAVTAPEQRLVITCEHKSPESFRPAQAVPLRVRFTLRDERNKVPDSAELRYRRVNQAETWQSVSMQLDKNFWQAAIPADYTDSVFPLQYYFRVKSVSNRVALVPGFDALWCNQPYFVMRQKA